MFSGEHATHNRRWVYLRHLDMLRNRSVKAALEQYNKGDESSILGTFVHA